MYHIFEVVYGESWSEIAPWLSCCLHRLLTIVSLAADLVHQDCIISGRMAKVHSPGTKTVWSRWGLFFFWSGSPLPASPLHSITEAQLFWISFIGLALHWTLSPSCFRLTWLMQFLSLKSLLELLLYHFLFVFSGSGQKDHEFCPLSKSYQNDSSRGC